MIGAHGKWEREVHRTMALLDAIHTPADVKKLQPAELPDLAREMRARIFDAVSCNGGHLKRGNHVVAVVGDASIVNGLAFEGVNNAGTLKRQLLIILNDNGMSISKPQGAFAQYLDRVRVSVTYEEMKRLGKKIVDELPGPVGHAIEGAWHSLRGSVKSAMWPGQIFENLGIK